MNRAATAGLAGSMLMGAMLPGAVAACAGPACAAILVAQADPAPGGQPPASSGDLGVAPTAQTASPTQPTPAAPAPAPPPAAAPAPPPSTASAPRAPAPAPPLGTVRNNPAGSANVGGTDPQYYSSTQSSPGRAQGGLQPAYGSTQRNSGLSDGDNAHPIGGASPYGGTQSSIGTPQFNNTATYGRPVGTPAPTRSLTGTVLPGNPNNYGRAPLGSSPITRDQIGSFGGSGGYTAQGVYTGTAGQTVGFGQPYPLSGRPVGGTSSSLPDATTPLRPYVPLDAGRGGGPTNSGYGLSNGSRPTTMDARGIQRLN